MHVNPAQNNKEQKKMAKQLASFPENTRSRTGYSRYPWEQWLDGTAWELTGPKVEKTMVDGEEVSKLHTVGEEDFTVPAKSFRSAAAQAAKTRGGEIRTAVTKVVMEDGMIREDVIIQYVAESPSEEDEDLTSEDAAALADAGSATV